MFKNPFQYAGIPTDVTDGDLLYKWLASNISANKQLFNPDLSHFLNLEGLKLETSKGVQHTIPYPSIFLSKHIEPEACKAIGKVSPFLNEIVSNFEGLPTLITLQLSKKVRIGIEINKPSLNSLQAAVIASCFLNNNVHYLQLCGLVEGIDLCLTGSHCISDSLKFSNIKRLEICLSNNLASQAHHFVTAIKDMTKLDEFSMNVRNTPLNIDSYRSISNSLSSLKSLTKLRLAYINPAGIHIFV